ncbi:MAG TPA: polyribonucleotide nucleotidyltransferase [Acidimicrobiia bacterium]|nr:polyribonucleotide nucleotidyltransferase [Acidimicrobiia bacterium]
MTGPITASAPIGETGKSLTFSTGLLAPQADGAVVVSVGETTVLVTAQASRGIREGIDFFPLTVDVEERMYAAGKIPGSFFRREGRPTEQAILACRLTDRPLRPSFPKGYRNETQIVATVLGADLQNPHDVLVINGASAALMISGIPFAGPVGAVRLAHHDGVWIPYPTYQEGDTSTFELVVAGRRLPDGDVAVMMVEAGGTEAAWELYQAGAPLVTEEVIAEGLEESKRWINESITAQLQLVESWVTERGEIEPIPYELQTDYDEETYEAVRQAASGPLSDALSVADKHDRNTRIDEISAETVAALAGTAEEPGKFETTPVKRALRSLQKEIVRSRIVNEGFRIDGRTPTDIRPLSAQVGLLKTAHGTGLFQRGETQVLSVTTLGMPRMEQMLDTIGIDEHKRYMHHYNFPPFSTGETGRVGSPKRREIGHGALAERALLPVVPSVEEFPYTLRVVSDVLSSNGSTSMGSVCGSTLSLMDAGVPLKAPVAGIAMGLVYAEGKYTTLTDILGAEDAFGDMDFKVAGTAEFVTALQLDTKIDGLPAEVLAEALRQAKDARLKILDVIREAIPEPRAEVAEIAPKIISFQIPLDRVGEVIGPKGKVINGIQQETGADINVDDDGVVGTVTIGGRDGGAVAEAKRMIELILNPPEADVGGIYTGKVVNITKFGAFVNILPGRDGLLHISKLGAGRRVDRVEDVLSLGTEVEVRVDDIDPQGKVSLSLVKPLDGTGGEGAGDGGDVGGESGGRAGGGDRDLVSFDADWDQTARDSFGDLGPTEVTGGGGGGGRPREGGDRDRDRGGRDRDRGRRPGGGRGRR